MPRVGGWSGGSLAYSLTLMIAQLRLSQSIASCRYLVLAAFGYSVMLMGEATAFSIFRYFYSFAHGFVVPIT